MADSNGENPLEEWEKSLSKIFKKNTGSPNIVVIPPPPPNASDTENKTEKVDKDEEKGILSNAFKFLAGALVVCMLIKPAINLTTPSDQSAIEVTDEQDNNSKITSKQRKFINNIAPYARRTQKEYGIYASVTIAQAILESSWGESELSAVYNNYFGIKSTNGKGVWYPTPNDAQKMSCFRVYDSIQGSTDDHGKLIGTTERYKEARKCFDEGKGPEAQIRAIKAAGYAEDPHYVAIIMQLINQFNLQQYDKQTKSIDINTFEKNAHGFVEFLKSQAGNPDPSKYIEPWKSRTVTLETVGDVYCGYFLMWGAKEFGWEDIVFADPSVETMVKHYDSDDGEHRYVPGTDTDYIPKEGDIIAFDWNNHTGRYDHVAAVCEDYDGNGWIYYVGGNQEYVGGKYLAPSVSRIKYGDKQIIGYGQPKYPGKSLAEKIIGEVTRGIKSFDIFDIFENVKGVGQFLLEKGTGIVDTAKELIGIEEKEDEETSEIDDTEEIEEIETNPNNQGKESKESKESKKSKKSKKSKESKSDSTYSEEEDPYVDPLSSDDEKIEEIEYELQ